MTKLIIGSQLRKARALLQLSEEEVAREIGVTSSAISEWEREIGQPTVKQLQELARSYGRSIDYFLKKTPETPTGIEFRGKTGKTLRSLDKETKLIIARFDELCRISVEIENSLDKKLKPTLPSFTEGPEVAARRLREEFGFKDGPTKNLREAFEKKGVRIFELPVPSENFSGFSFRHSVYGLCVLINATEPKPRRNFTLAHEIAHLIYQHSPSVCFIPSQFVRHQSREEHLANKFAVEFLMPESGIKKDFHERAISDKPSEMQLKTMASKWSVSVLALAYRLENLGLIIEGFSEKISEIAPKHFRAPRGPKWRRRLGERFVNISFEAYQHGKITSGKLAQTLGLPLRKTIEEIEKHAGN